MRLNSSESGSRNDKARSNWKGSNICAFQAKRLFKTDRFICANVLRVLLRTDRLCSNAERWQKTLHRCDT